MANKGFAYGLSAAVAAKIESKRDAATEAKVLRWIEEIVGEKMDSEKKYEENLKDGVFLCKLMNTIKPKAIKDVSKSAMPFKQMENIQKFLTAATKYGVLASDLFQTVDLYQASNIPAVTQGIMALGSICQDKPEWDENSESYKGWPKIGAKPAHEHKREFDEQTIAEGKKIIGIQAGSNKLASQSGQNFGGRRQVS